MVKDKTLTSLNATKNADKLPTALNQENQENKLKTSDDFTNKIEDVKEITQEAVEKTEIQEEKVDKSDLKEDVISADHKSLAFKPLADIFVDLDEVTPLDEGQRLLLDDDDIQVTLYFTADRPSEHVSVIVMSVSNKSKLPVKDFHFEASVKKVTHLKYFGYLCLWLLLSFL